MRLRHISKIGLAGVALIGCRSETPTALHQAMRIEHAAFNFDNAELQATLPVPLNHVPGSRKAEEEAALSQLLTELPESARRTILESLNPASTMRVAQITNPKLAALYETVATIRGLDIAARELERSRNAARTHSLTVTLALVDPVVLGTVRARIVRDPYKTNSELILLRSGDASVDDVAAGIALMYRSRRTFGDNIRNVIRADVVSFSGPSNGSAREQAQSVLALVSAAQPSSFPGFGVARLITLHLDPIRSP